MRLSCQCKGLKFLVGQCWLVVEVKLSVKGTEDLSRPLLISWWGKAVSVMDWGF